MALSGGGWLGRTALSLVILLFGALALVSGLDRMSLDAPALARLIPATLRAQAARSAATQAILREQPQAAVEHARQAVASDPVHPASTSLLGTAYLLAGDLAGAEAAFRVAARFGWREPATQLYWYEAARQAGDLPRAVDRVDALLRTHPGFPTTEQVLAPLESTAAGRQALIVRMADRPHWLRLYLRPEEGVSDETLDRRSQVLIDLATAGTRLGCETAAPFAYIALQRGARRQAQDVWVAHCPGASLDGGLADGGFEQFDRAGASPFGWRPQLSGDVTLRTAEKERGNRVLQMRNRSSVSRPVLRQAVSLEPGTYLLVGKVEPGRLAASLGCGQPPPMPSLVVGDIGGGGQRLRVEPCSRLELALWLRPTDEEVELDAVELRKIG